MVALGGAPPLDGPALVNWVVQDHYPLHWGAKATVGTVTAQLRLQEIGYRLQYCDLLRELIEGDGHAFSCLQSRAYQVSSRPWSLVPADVTSPSDQAKAKTIAEYCTQALKRIPAWRTHVASMLWAITYGVTCREIMWDRKRSGEWCIDELRFVHTRRLGYDWDWNVRLTAYAYADWGMQLSDMPGKFWLFEPKLSDEYPTREGLGRTLAYWLAFKRFGQRDFIAYVEKYGKPYAIAKWKTGADSADEETISTANQIARNLAAGTTSGAAIPDTLDILIEGGGTKNSGGGSGENTPHKALIAGCDQEVSKLVLGQAFSTNASQGAGLGTDKSIFEDVTRNLIRNDAQQISESITRDIVRWLVRLNFGPDAADRLCPTYQIDVEDSDDLGALCDQLTKLKALGMRIGEQWLHEKFGVPEPQEGEDVGEQTDDEADEDGESDVPQPGKGKDKPDPKDDKTPDDSSAVDDNGSGDES